MSPSASPNENGHALETERRPGTPDFEFSRSNSPEASIIIPAHNQLEYTWQCLRALAAHASAASFEVLLADDASDLSVFQRLAEIPGLKVVRNFKNLGFVRSCNRAAALAKGKYLVFLNNDTEVCPGWLDALLQAFATYPDAGLVGSMLLNTDRTLQEAGGIFWRDGSAWNFGRGSDPALPDFNYFRETDYCSGASIMIPQGIWRRLGGFDEIFAPAYCEDSDLAFRVRQAGYKVYYQPTSRVIHHEGKSNGTDTSTGIKRFQVVNQKTLFSRWKTELEAKHWPNGERVFVARDRSGGRKHVVIVDHYVPKFDRDAGSKTIYQYMKLFVEQGFSVKFIPDNFYRDETYTDVLEGMGVEVLYGVYYRDNIHRWIEQNGRYIDYVFFSRADVAVKYMDSFAAHSPARRLFYGHDLHFLRMRAGAMLSDLESSSAAEQYLELEKRVWNQMDVIYYPAEEECEFVRSLFPGKAVRRFPIYIFPDSASEERRIFAETEGLLFVGGFAHRPNQDALLWFVENVLPAVQTACPGAVTHVCGSFIPESILALASPHLRFHQNISDDELAQFYCRARVAIVPLRYGGGVKGKVVDALYRQVPLVTTTIGAQGLPGLSEVAVVADAGPDFAAGVINLLTDEARWTALARSSRAFVLKGFSKAAALKILAHDVEFAANE